MTAPRWLALYAIALIAGTLVHHPGLLAAALVLVLAVSGPGRAGLLRRALLMVGALLALLTVAYLGMAWFTDGPDWVYLARLILRVLLLAVLTAWLLRDLDLNAALAPWPAMRRLLALIRIQYTALAAIAAEFAAAQRSRSSTPPGLRQRYRMVTGMALGLLDRAIHRSESLDRAMRSRGARDG